MVRALASITELVSSGRLVPQPADAAALLAVLVAGRRDLEAAEANRATYAPWSDAMLYEAGLRAARVVVQAAGYRIDAGKGAHAATIDAADVLTGQAITRSSRASSACGTAETTSCTAPRRSRPRPTSTGRAWT